MNRKRTSHAVTRLPHLVFVLFVAHAMQTAFAENNAASEARLVGKVDYWFVGHRGQKDDAGRKLVWEAKVEGDLTGTMKWWFADPSPIAPQTYTAGQTTFYAARWELWVDDKLLLAGETAGKTVFADGTDGIWDGHGRVTEATGQFSAAIGRQVYETGPVILGDDPPRTFSGTGMFVIY